MKIISIQFLKILLYFLKASNVSVQESDDIFIPNPLYAIFYFSLQKLLE